MQSLSNIDYSKLSKPEKTQEKRTWLIRIIWCTIFYFIIVSMRLTFIVEANSSYKVASRSAVIVIPYVGDLNWDISKHFFKSISSQPFDVLFVSMDNEDILLSHNTTQIRKVDMKTDFNGFATDRLCLAYNCTLEEKKRLKYVMQKAITKNAIQLCSLRPAFLYIFNNLQKSILL